MIFIFNGPPGTGKDESCLFLQQFGFLHLSFKEELFIETFKYFDVSSEWFMSKYHDRNVKDAPEEKLKLKDGTILSRRQALIHVSENYIKVNYGKDYFGKKLAEKLTFNGPICVSDGGFEEELHPIINKIEAKNITLIQLHRDGCFFKEDSRKYFNEEICQELVIDHRSEIEKDSFLKHRFGIRTYRIHNNGTKEQFHFTIKKIYEQEKNARTDSQEI